MIILCGLITFNFIAVITLVDIYRFLVYQYEKLIQILVELKYRLPDGKNNTYFFKVLGNRQCPTFLTHYEIITDACLSSGFNAVIFSSMKKQRISKPNELCNLSK